MRSAATSGLVPLPGFDDVAEPDCHAPDETAPSTPGPAALPFLVEVRRSARRTRTVGARLRDGVLHITVPSWMSRTEEARWADDMTQRYVRKHTATTIDLAERATALARRYRLPPARTVGWADMTSRWGTCTPSRGEIRVSRHVAAFPPWVLDYVLVHELAHLEVLEHSAAFWALVARYPKAERALGYLLAKSETS